MRRPAVGRGRRCRSQRLAEAAGPGLKKGLGSWVMPNSALLAIFVREVVDQSESPKCESTVDFKHIARCIGQFAASEDGDCSAHLLWFAPPVFNGHSGSNQAIVLFLDRRT